MDFRRILSALGFLLVCVATTLLFPILVSLVYGEPVGHFLCVALSSGALGLAGYFFFRSGQMEISNREGFAIVGLGWLLACALGALPYLLSGTCSSFVDAFFESSSGFTTTGATVIADVETLPRGILFWRSLTHWLGGMGIILLSMAILPMLGVGGMQLYKAEVPGPATDRMKPRIRETAKTLWLVYFLISVVEFLLLLLGGMDAFDSICHTFGTMATGGFSTRNASIGAYGSAYLEWVIIFFMFVAGANFALHYFFLTGNYRRYLRDAEFRFYLFLVLGLSLLLTFVLRAGPVDDWGLSLRLSAFQVVSILTTTGYVTADYEQWPFGLQAVLFVLMFVGGCAGSTGGSVKCVRILLLLKQSKRQVIRLIHPKAVVSIKMGRRSVSDEVMDGIIGFFLIYLGIFLAGSVAVSFFGLDFTSALASVAACLGNVGPGLGVVGPAETYAGLAAPVKVILTFCMILGRLEIFALLVLFMPVYWKK